MFVDMISRWNPLNITFADKDGAKLPAILLYFNLDVLMLYQLGLQIDFYFVSHDAFPLDYCYSMLSLVMAFWKHG